MKVPTNDNELDGEFTGRPRDGEEDFDHLLSDDSNSYDDDYTFDEEPNVLLYSIISAIAWIRYFCMYRRTETLLAVFLTVSITLALTGAIVEYEGYESGPQHKRPILHDYSEIKSAMELKAGNIDHWCFEGGDDSCPMCEDPLEGSIPQALNWRRAFIKNNQQTRIAMKENKELEVIFLGDSITEALTGTVGGAKDESLNNIKDVFTSQFSKENGGVYEGIALGISGNTSPNLLWRITQNEIPVELNPKIWWITIGMNDLTSTMCSEEVTLMGILRVVEELLFTRPGSTIVINSILPKAITRSGKILKGNFIRNKYFDPIEQVNNRLKRFAANHSNRVRFFDADAIFVQKTRGKVMMRRELFRDKYHPNAEGHKIWGKAQIKLISDILTGKQKETEEDLVSDHSSTSKDTPTIPEQDYYDYSGYDDNLSLYNMWDDDE